MQLPCCRDARRIRTAATIHHARKFDLTTGASRPGNRKAALLGLLTVTRPYARPVTTETDLDLIDGRRLHMYNTDADNARADLAVFWRHATPNIGAPPEVPGRSQARHPLGVI
jgi:hypothetical protein